MSLDSHSCLPDAAFSRAKFLSLSPHPTQPRHILSSPHCVCFVFSLVTSESVASGRLFSHSLPGWSFLLPQRVDLETLSCAKKLQLDFSLILLFLVKLPFLLPQFMWIGLSSLSCQHNSLPSICAVMPLRKIYYRKYVWHRPVI